MNTSPTPTERTAIRTAYAALRVSASPNSEIVEQIVYALGAAGLLQSPETAADIQHTARSQGYVQALAELQGMARDVWTPADLAAALVVLADRQHLRDGLYVEQNHQARDPKTPDPDIAAKYVDVPLPAPVVAA